MDVVTSGLGEKVYDSYPPRKMLVEIFIEGAVIAGCILMGLFWGETRIFGYPSWGILFGALLFLIIPSIFAIELIALQERFKIYERGVYLHTFKFDGDLAVVYRNKPYIEWRAYRFEEVLSITPFLFTTGSMLMADLGLRFTLPHPVQAKVVGDISHSAWQIKKIPEAVDTLKAHMGPLWSAKYRPDEPATMGVLEDTYMAAVRELWRMKPPPGEPLPYDIPTEKDVARYVERGMTSEDFKAIAESRKKVRMLMKEMT